MMKLSVSAPGKVILFGEHAVVYSKRAIAAGISLRTTISFDQVLTSSNLPARVTLFSTQLSKSNWEWPIEDISKMIQRVNGS
jgi:mevalonate kinase